MKKIKLFCFPFAGGSSTFYTEWKKASDEFIDVTPLEYKGRGKRVKEKFYSNFEEGIIDLFNEIEPLISKENYAFFGHSMGSLVAYELTHLISQHGYNPPCHIFVSGRNSPEHKNPFVSNLTNLSDNEFVEYISKLGGIPTELLLNKELLSYFLPIIRSDINNLNNYSFKSRDKLSTNLSVFYGLEDPLTVINNDWANYTNNNCDTHIFQGNHFFIKDNVLEVMGLINQTLKTYRA
ncbi:thioesterase [Bacillus tropicus]|uniref:thioesterase II family protein n=1 Tax=Bacillus tropicus TaxID=2026188 RepID=UPI001123EFED|nr:thioesterase domain-containing protein [Bacillus tropicus]TNP12921.1 thioesterase [Bacillus tropicus]